MFFKNTCDLDAVKSDLIEKCDAPLVNVRTSDKSTDIHFFILFILFCGPEATQPPGNRS